jgi:hypothetical protein
MSTQPYEILVGVGRLYVAAAGTAKPVLDATPGAGWTDLGETDDGVKVTKTQNIETFTTDQRTGKVKAVRTKEGLTIETNLTAVTLENLAKAINGTVTDIAPGSGTIGYRSLMLHAGATVQEFALLFRGSSPYGNYPAQFYVPRAYISDDIEMEYKRDDKTLIPVKFEALESLTAAEGEQFGVYEAQDAAAL